MKITKKYGNTIYGDNTISQTITYHFDKIKDFMNFGKITKMQNKQAVGQHIWIE